MRPYQYTNFNPQYSTEEQSNKERTLQKLSLLGGSITIVGSVISTVAETILLHQSAQQLENVKPTNNDDKLNELQQQIHHLTKELEQLKQVTTRYIDEKGRLTND